MLLSLFPRRGAENWTSETCFVMVTPPVPNLVKSSGLYDNLVAYFSSSLADEILDSVRTLALLSLMITVAMVLSFCVCNLLSSNFRNVAPAHKKWYIIANLFKAALLGISCISKKYWAALYRIYFFDQFLAIPLKRTMAIYAVTDVVALWMVPKLPTSTIIHHVTSTVLFFAACVNDMTVQGWTGNLGVAKMIVVYGNFSTVAYLVNAYLALRVLYPPNSRMMNFLCLMAFWSYVLCCTGNWGVHLIWFLHGLKTLSFSIAALLYLVAVCFVVNDDIVLLRWLWKRSSPAAENEPENKKTTTE